MRYRKPFKQVTRRGAAVCIAGLLGVGALGGTAAATLVGSSGGQQLRVDKRTQDTPTVTTSAHWTEVPGASVNIEIPDGASRLIDASFTAESTCSGPMTGHCSVRIMANNIELNPVTGTDYAFDSDPPGAGGVDQAEGHALDRNRRLAPGAWNIHVQRAVVGAGVVFGLDDWHFAVYQNA